MAKHRKPFRNIESLSLRNLSRKFLDPIDWLSETIFSIMIALIFTLAYRIFALSSFTTSADPSESTINLLLAITGAVIAWGFIDGVIYAVLSIFEREEQDRFLRELQAAPTEQDKIEVVTDEFGYTFESIVEDSQKEHLYYAILQAVNVAPKQRQGLKKEDILAAIAHVFIALIAVIPCLLPLVIFNKNLLLAIRLSNLVSFGMLFLTGYSWGKYTGINPVRTGIIIMMIAITLALLAIPLGG